jgi:hypothetical protein
MTLGMPNHGCHDLPAAPWQGYIGGSLVPGNPKIRHAQASQIPIRPAFTPDPDSPQHQGDGHFLPLHKKTTGAIVLPGNSDTGTRNDYNLA